jgi:hypothetical protein
MGKERPISRLVYPPRRFVVKGFAETPGLCSQGVGYQAQVCDEISFVYYMQNMIMIMIMNNE